MSEQTLTPGSVAPVTFSLESRVALVTMDDGKVNAVSHQLLDALEDALDRAEREADAVVLAGRPGKFCAGYDLKVMQGAEPAEREALSQRGGRMVHRLYSYPKPLVAAATGHAVALGAILLLACDTRVGSRGSYTFGLNETAIGLPLPTYGTALAGDRICTSQLTAAVVQSRMYDPDAAVDAGFLDVLAEEAAVVETATEIATQLTALPEMAHTANKLKLRAATLAEVGASLGLD